MNRALSSTGRGCLSATFSRPIPIYFSDKLSVQGWVALGFLHLVLLLGWVWLLGVFFGFFWLFRNFTLTFLLFKVGSLGERNKCAGQGTHKV